ncbi:MAG: hypothetical protein WBG37_18825 [Desulfobacterales bacterium]
MPGQDTFSTGALKLVQQEGGYGAVPIDGWRQLLLYRKDLFEQQGLPAPDNWRRILQAAQALHNPPKIWGFIAATEPDKIYTEQVFEHFALSGGVRLRDSAGNISLNTLEMIETLKFYNTLAKKTPRGNLGFIDSRHEYVTGRAAMIEWSPFILDEISGLRQDLPVVPDIRQGRLGYLAQNTGFLSTIIGPGGPAQYYSINCLGIARDGNKADAQQWIEFLLSDGYLKWLNMAPWGKLPMRKGTPEDNTRYVKGWINLDHGPRETAQIIASFDQEEVMTLVEHAFEDFDRWRVFENNDALISKI